MDCTTKKIIAVLKQLSLIAEDGKNGYKKAAENIKDINMQDLFIRFSCERAAYLGELQQLIINAGGTRDDHVDMPGSLHHIRIGFKSAVLLQNTHAVIYSCAVGESVAIKLYCAALGQKYITGNVRSVLAGQLSCIQTAMQIITSYGSVAVV
ncbi:MAG TPA: PA2169 family four-helix-bundle protein [Panacibacter sp.]|nr:PA2169 family four-helix-bundle protein [Panacibacter sp.]